MSKQELKYHNTSAKTFDVYYKNKKVAEVYFGDKEITLEINFDKKYFKSLSEVNDYIFEQVQ